AARRLASQWVTANPSAIAAQVSDWERTLQSNEDRMWPRWSPYVCQLIAAEGVSATAWLDAFWQSCANADLAAPFLERAISRREQGWDDRLRTALGNSAYQTAAVAIILQMPDVPSEFVNAARRCVPALRAITTTLCMRGALSEEHVRMLLRHDDP